jgi:hypothetical protein
MFGKEINQGLPFYSFLVERKLSQTLEVREPILPIFLIGLV